MTKKSSNKKISKRKNKKTVKKNKSLPKKGSNFNDLPNEVLNYKVGEFLDVESKLNLLKTKDNFNFEITTFSEWFEYIHIKYKTIMKEMQTSIIPNPDEHVFKLQFRLSLGFDGKGIYDFYELKPYGMVFIVKFNNDIIELHIQTILKAFVKVGDFKSTGQIVRFIKKELLKKTGTFIDKTDKDLEKIIKSTTPDNIPSLLHYKLTTSRIKELEKLTPFKALYDELNDQSVLFNMPIFGDKVKYHIDCEKPRCYIEHKDEYNLIFGNDEN